MKKFLIIFMLVVGALGFSQDFGTEVNTQLYANNSSYFQSEQFRSLVKEYFYEEFKKDYQQEGIDFLVNNGLASLRIDGKYGYCLVGYQGWNLYCFDKEGHFAGYINISSARFSDKNPYGLPEDELKAIYKWETEYRNGGGAYPLEFYVDDEYIQEAINWSLGIE